MQAITSNPLFFPVLLTVIIILAFPLVAGYLVLVERKVLADIQVRLGPMRVGPHGFLQPIADAVKLLIKEDIIPTDADRMIFWMAPCISCFTALSCFAVLPFTDVIRVADVNVGLLVVSAMSAIGVFGIILGGWSSNSHYSLLGGLRSAAQLVSYEVALSIAALSAVMVAGSLSIVLFVGSGLLCVPMMRRLKVGWHRAFMAVLAATLVFCGLIFLVPAINQAVASLFWFLFKVGVVIYALIWVRGTFPRFRYDQLMNIGWKYMIPIALGCVLVNAIIGVARG